MKNRLDAIQLDMLELGAFVAEQKLTIASLREKIESYAKDIEAFEKYQHGHWTWCPVNRCELACTCGYDQLPSVRKI